MAARKTSTKPTRIWTYPCRVENESDISVALARANRYYNRLVEIERARHARYVAIRRQHAPELASLEDEWLRLDDEIAALYRDVRDVRASHWRESGGDKRRLLPADAKAKIDDLEAEKKKVSAASKEHRAAFRALLEPGQAAYKVRASERAGKGAGPRTKGIANAAVFAEMLDEPQWGPVWRQIAISDDDAHKATLAARASCGLSTGTYLAIEEAVQRAKKDSLPRPPRFRRYDGNGKLAVQTRGASFADAVAGTTALTIRPAANDPGRRGDQSKVFLVGLDQSIPRGERSQIVAVTKMHRRPPDDAEIKWAALLVRRIGERTRYEFQLTLEHASFAEPKRPAGTQDAVHVQIGWARVEGGVRVAHWTGGEVVVPDSMLSQHAHASDIDGAADKLFDRAKRRLRRWMHGGPHRLTAWHRMGSDRARYLLRRACIEYANWHFECGAHSLWKEWKQDRLSRGEDLYAEPRILRPWLSLRGVEGQDAVIGFWAYVWARKDAHLCQLAADSRRRYQNRRDALFRREAIRIATEVESVTVDSYKIAALKELPSLSLPGDAPRDQAQHNAQVAAPGRFRELLLEVMGPRCTPCERPSGEQKEGTARRRKSRGKSDLGASSDEARGDTPAHRSQSAAE